jgi:hypothetical protein
VTKPRAQLRTIGLAPIGAPVRSTIEEARNATSTATPAIAPADRAQAAGPSDRGVVKPGENKPDEKSRIAKKKQIRRAAAAQVYELPDGRQVVVQSSRNDTRRTGGTGPDQRDNNLNNAPRFGGRARVAWPGSSGAPF